MSFIIKIDKLPAAIQKYREAGGDTKPVEAEVAAIERLVRAGEFDAAEKRLTKLLSQLRHGEFKRTA